jgi:general secretion pathway protein D
VLIHTVRRFLPAVCAAALLLAAPAHAQTTNPDGDTVVTPEDGADLPPPMTPTGKVKLDFFDTSLWDMVRFFARLKRMNFVIGDPKELQSKKVTIISNYEVSPEEAYQAFLSALEVSGYSISTVGDTSKIVKSSEAGQKPIRIGTGLPGRSDDFVTQLIQLENVNVSDMTKIIQSMAPSEAKIIAYPPTNTLIITDTANNIRKLYKLMNELDVAAPKSSMVIYQLRYAESGEVQSIIEELYGTAETSDDSSKTSSRTSRSSRRSSRSSRSSKTADTEAVTAGKKASYIQKVLNDERTNSLIVLANEDGHNAILDLLKKIDVDVDPQNRAQIHVVYLENAKADEVATVLSQLSQGGTGTGANSSRRGSSKASANTPAARVAAAAGRTSVGGDDEAGSGGAIAAFDSGMRIAADENTNSLVIIANTEDFRVVETVIEKLDIRRRQVFVDAVVLELTSEDSANFNIAAHVPQSPGENAVGFLGAQLGTQSLGLSQDALTGLAFGVYGQSVDVPITGPDGLPTTLSIPAFGIALNAIKTAGSTNIISNPNLTTLDNQEAQIVVGRKIPFPTNSTFNNVGQPIISFQREDVAITLKITPQINSENYVTLELEIEVQEVEDSAEGAAVQAAGGGFITSKRELKTTALVRDNQTMVIGGLVGNTESQTENKVPVLGDIPLIGALFRSSSRTDRKTNLMVFLTPHIIDDPDDMYEVQRVKEAQRQEFLRRFYGKSRDAYWAELRSLLRYSMNLVEEPSMYRGPTAVEQDLRLDGAPLSDDTAAAAQQLGAERTTDPGATAGEIDDASTPIIVIDDLPDEAAPVEVEVTVEPADGEE